MYDPNPNAKDVFFSTFEDLLKNHSKSEEDDKRRDEIQQQLKDLPTNIAGDK